MEEILKFFRPELINRFDEVVIFEPLQYPHMIEIVKLQLKNLAKLLEEQEIGFSATDETIKEIVRVGFDPIFGARPLKRAIQKLIENPLSTKIIKNEIKPGDQVLVDFDGENFIFNVERIQLVEKDQLDKQKIKKFFCEKCGNKFETETIDNSTPICSRCVSTKVQITVNNKEKKEELVRQEQATNLKKELIDNNNNQRQQTMPTGVVN